MCVASIKDNADLLSTSYCLRFRLRNPEYKQLDFDDPFGTVVKQFNF